MRGPGRVTTVSSMGRMAPAFTAVMPAQPGRDFTASGRHPVVRVAEDDHLGSASTRRSSETAQTAGSPLVIGSPPASPIISVRNESGAGP